MHGAVWTPHVLSRPSKALAGTRAVHIVAIGPGVARAACVTIRGCIARLRLRARLIGTFSPGRSARISNPPQGAGFQRSFQSSRAQTRAVRLPSHATEFVRAEIQVRIGRVPDGTLEARRCASRSIVTEDQASTGAARRTTRITSVVLVSPRTTLRAPSASSTWRLPLWIAA
jgi:hypothetical protein